MSTPEFKEQFRKNSETITRGLPDNCLVRHIILNCPRCDEENGDHLCTNCGNREMSEKTCIENDGHCVDCQNDEDYNNKYGRA